MSKPQVEFKLLDDRFGDTVALPDYETAGAAAMDLRAMRLITGKGENGPITEPMTETLVIQPGEKAVLIGAGFSHSLLTPTLMSQILPRSSKGHKEGLVLGNGTGLIDSDYEGQLFISAWNRGTEPVTIEPEERIAQLVFAPVVQVEPVIVTEFSTASARGEGGFGHSGKQ